MAEEADEQFKMLSPSQRQREELLRFLNDGYSGVMMHGTLQKNLLAKGFLQWVEHDGRKQLELTELGKKVAERVREDDIRRAGKRMATELTQTLVAADQEMRTPPPARPGRVTDPVQFDPRDQINVRRRELDDIMN
jgi:DNA-binding PadR family transcriptional regulator